MPGLSCSRTYRSDSCGRGGAESFWNSFGNGLRPQCISQVQLSFPAASRWFPAPSSNVRPELWYASPCISFASAQQVRFPSPRTIRDAGPTSPTELVENVGDICSEPWHISRMEFDSAGTKK